MSGFEFQLFLLFTIGGWCIAGCITILYHTDSLVRPLFNGIGAVIAGIVVIVFWPIHEDALNGLEKVFTKLHERMNRD